MHAVPSRSTLTWGRVAIAVTILSYLGYFVSTIARQFLNDGGGFRFTMEALSYLVVVSFLTFSALMYLLARQGALYRFHDHRRVPRGELDRHFTGYDEAITVLVPSYDEEPDVVRTTLWSAALQEFPDLRAVLLIDDNPNPTDTAVWAKLAHTRDLAQEIESALQAPYERMVRAEAAFAKQPAGAASIADVEAIAADYRYAAEWLEAMADSETVNDHVGEFFVDQVLAGLASDLRLTLLGLDAAVEQDAHPGAERIVELRRRLVWIFRAKVSTFERKQYASLSHEANKAMNINAYISVMGKRMNVETHGAKQVLREVAADEPADLEFADTTYLLTLDADSILLRDYCVRLVHFLEEAENARVAVVQTPYSSFRGAPTRIERIAGATTDIQHILHQGMTYFNATFWVGANAVIRKAALEDIVEVETVGGHEVRTYIQDRTVIEDTESSVDLGLHGWTLVNYPERLSYSATPPDFGSLIVQRRRWANGGLLILPKLWEQVRTRKQNRERVLWRELMLRVNYMASITWASFGLIFLLFYPYDSRLLSPLVVGAALPYFIAMGFDLRKCGHRATDIFRIYGLNLVLLTVNLAGVLKSVQQAFTGAKIPFARTPKVRNRTAAPGRYVLVPFLIVGFSLFTVYRDVQLENWGNAAFAMFNAITCSFAIRAYVGLRNSVVDLSLGGVSWLYVDKKTKAPKGGDPVVVPDNVPVDWESILYEGDRRLNRDVRDQTDRRRRVLRS